MGTKQIRTGQLITTFGPGSLYMDRRGIPHIVCGLDHWFKRSDSVVDCERPEEFHIFETRLASLLHINCYCKPPDFRPVRPGMPLPPNAMLFVPAHRFPTWYHHTITGQLRKFNLNTARIDPPRDGGRWQPVRFVSVCSGGHLGEFPWKEWIGCSCEGGGDLYLTDRGGSELTSIRVECRSCPPGSPGRKGKNLAGTTTKPDPGEQSAFEKSGIICQGHRPWLGEKASENGCRNSLIGALINQTNLYFPKMMSAINLPDLELQDDSVIRTKNEIEKDQSNGGILKTLWNMNNRSGAIVLAKDSLKNRNFICEESDIEAALASLFSDDNGFIKDACKPANPESALLEFRRAEFNIIRNEVNDPDRIPNLMVIPSKIPKDLERFFSRVNLVERLRETRAFYGFDRIEPNRSPLDGMPDSAINQLFFTPPQIRWLPAIQVHGEGIYLEFNEDNISTWQNNNNDWISQRINEAFINRLSGLFQTLPPLASSDLNWASKYLMIHSFAHILINQLIFECGYSTASLRERLYISNDPAAPMAGVLIYTSAGDSEGTMGGLVRLGRPERLGHVIKRALSRASWCSADPVCSENMGGQGSRLVNMAACHACILLPETSCETINHGLDRSIVVGTPEDRLCGFMSGLIKDVYSVE